MVERQFSRSLYDAYDRPAKEALVRLLENRGHSIVNTAETYDADVISQKDGVTYANEAEVKLAWKAGTTYSYPDVRIPERKGRLLLKHLDEVLNFYVFRADFEAAWRIKDIHLTERSLKEATGRYLRKGERFFTIKVNKCELVKVKKE